MAGSRSEERWTRLEEICVGALEVDPSQRDVWLTEACDGDAELLAEARSLLSSHDPDFMAEPLIEVRALDAETPAGPLVEGYRIVRPLGRGGMGEVFLATRVGEDFERHVALKVLRRGLDTDDVVQRFRQERKILSALNHPSIASLIDGGMTGDGRPYFVMEYVDGTDLDRWVRDTGPDNDERVRLVIEVARAVAHAHSALVIHRDLKPANVMVSRNGDVRLLDFGIAKLTNDDADGGASAPRTRAGRRVLTLEYAAPEQIRGGAVTTATDVWALGVILYELLVDALPWAGLQEPEDLERAVLHDDPPPPSRAATALGVTRPIGSDLDVIVLKALSKEPERRYTSPAALAEDLQRYLEGRPILARPSSAGYRARKFVCRRPWVAATAAIGVVALVAASAVPWVAARRADAERDKAMEVQSFLLEMFGATGGDRATGDTLTARGLLDRQAELVPGLYSDQPDMYARMLRVLGEGYERLGLLEEAESHARTALELEREHGGLSPDGLAASLNLLGWVRQQTGDSEAAADLLSEAIEIRRGLGRRYAGPLARSLNDLGVVRDAMGDIDQAAELHTEAYELRLDEGGLTSRATAVSASNVAVTHFRRGDYDQATDFAEVALQALRAQLGADHQRSIIAQSNLAAIRVAGGDLDGARTEFEELLDRQTRLQGRSHPVTTGLMASLGTIQVLSGDGVAAEALMREARTIEAGRSAPVPARVAGTLHLLGRALVLQERFDEGIAVLDTARLRRIKALGPDHAEVAETIAAIAEGYRLAGIEEEALSWQRRALDAFERAFGADHPQTVVQRERLAEWGAGR